MPQPPEAGDDAAGPQRLRQQVVGVAGAHPGPQRLQRGMGAAPGVAGPTDVKLRSTSQK